MSRLALVAAAAAIVILGTAGGGYAATVDETVLMLNFKAADSNGDGYVTEDEIAADSAAAFSSLDNEPRRLPDAGRARAA